MAVNSLDFQPGWGYYMTLVLVCYTRTVPLLRCVGLVAADLLYGANYIVLGHPCFADAAEADTTNK